MLIGAHVSVAGGPSRAFERATAIGAASFQIFTRNARGWRSGPLMDEERKAFRKEARRTGLPVIAHGGYLTNLASEDPAMREKSLHCLADELTRCERLGVGSLVIHPGCHPDPKRGIRLIADALDQIHVETPRFRSRICLEVTAGQGTAIGWRFEHLAEILAAVRYEKRLSVCLDTCHLFAAGYDLSTEVGYEKVMREFHDLVGLDRVTCVHLNDCKKGLGCRVDRHEELGKGTLGVTPFACLVNDRRFEGVIGVLETPVPERYAEAIQLLNSLVRK
ncbi:MAG TPA: deoxyribonuclease IV [Myxococcaceae bacterium]|nr:deoxyribonuclease IV [Myxococcaceae bacterium]